MRPAALSNPSWEATLDELSPHPASPRNYHAAFFKENRRRGRRQQHEVGNPGTRRDDNSVAGSTTNVEPRRDASHNQASFRIG